MDHDEHDADAMMIMIISENDGFVVFFYDDIDSRPTVIIITSTNNPHFVRNQSNP